MHLAERFALPRGIRARPYRGSVDHPTMVAILRQYRIHVGDPEMPTTEGFDNAYRHLDDCDPANDIAIIEGSSGDPIGYVRVRRSDLEGNRRDCILFSPLRPEFLDDDLFCALVVGQEAHMASWAAGRSGSRYRASAAHPGPGLPARDESAWLESAGYEATEWGAWLVRPHLDDVPSRQLPPGVELRPVSVEQIRTIWDADIEASRGAWDFFEATEEQFASFVDDPELDITLWKVAWAGDQVVGQVKSFVNHDENAERGYRRGYTENISTHRDWRNQGIAGALLAASLVELRDRGHTEAALGVDTNNPGGAFQLYTGLGFELRSTQAVYTRPMPVTE